MNILQKCTVATDKQNWMPLKVTEPGKLHIALVEDIRSGAPYAITFQGYSDGCQYVEQLKPVPISAIVCGINDWCIEGQPLLHVITMLRVSSSTKSKKVAILIQIQSIHINVCTCTYN